MLQRVEEDSIGLLANMKNELRVYGAGKGVSSWFSITFYFTYSKIIQNATKLTATTQN